MDGIVLLNNDHTFLSVIEWQSWEKAIRFVVKGKAQVVKNSDKQIRYGKGVMYVPKVLRMIYQVIKSGLTMKVKYTSKAVFARDGYACAYCPTPAVLAPKDLTVDHILPKSRGGKSDLMIYLVPSDRILI